MVPSPHVLVVDDFNNRTGHFPAVHIDPLQQRLQPAHVTLNVGVEEGEHLACNTETVAQMSTEQRSHLIRDTFPCPICTNYKCPRLKLPFDPSHSDTLSALQVQAMI